MNYKNYSNTLQKTFYYCFLAQLAAIVFSIAVAHVLYVLLFFIWLALIYEEKEIIVTTFDIIVLSFFLIRIFTIIMSEFPTASSITYLREVTFYPYYFIAVSFIRRYKIAGMRTAMQVLLYSAILPSLYAIFSVITGELGRGASVSGGYYFFAVHLGFTLTFTLVLILIEADYRRKNLYIILSIIIFVALLSTYTRSMWIAAFLSLILFGFFGYKKRMPWIFLIITIVIVAVPPLRERFSTLMSPLQHSSGRLELWNFALDRILLHPYFGFGPETFSQIVGDRSQFFDQFVGSWHNELLQIQIESGVFALCVLLVMYLIPLVSLFVVNKNTSSDSEKFMRYFILFTFVVILPSILFASIIISILNGMVLKFIFAGYSFIGKEGKFYRVYKLKM